jgi:hypothetical protein
MLDGTLNIFIENLATCHVIFFEIRKLIFLFYLQILH